MSNVVFSVNTKIQIDTGATPLPEPFVFSLQPYHFKAYQVLLNDFDLSGQVTSLSGSLNADSIFFNVVIGGLGLADAISARADGAVVINEQWVSSKTGLVEDSQLLMQAGFELLDWHLGAASSSVNISARGINTASDVKVVEVSEVFYASNSQVRLPFNGGIAIGDTVNYPLGSMVVGNISFSLFPNSEMTITV